MKTKQLCILLFSKKYTNPISFINKITMDLDHAFWWLSRDFAREILSTNTRWRWLSYRIDDFALEVQKIMQKKLQKWLFKAQLNCSKMKIDTIENTISWLLDRYIAECKNLFDKRSRNYIDIAKIDYLIKLSYMQRGELC